MTLSSLPAGPIGANCYFVKVNDVSPTGVLIDPGGEAKKLLARCEALPMTPEAILLTHGHFDHTGAVKALVTRYPGLAVYAHPADARGGSLYWSGLPGVRAVGDGEELTIAGLTFVVLATPGHSPGSVVYRCGDALFTGDTLFAGSRGRTDLPGGDGAAMTASLRRLGALEGDFTVYPGHGAASTLETERQTNPCLREALAP